MEKIKINLNDMAKIKEFCNVARSFASDVDVTTDRFKFDGKSIMGLFAADLSKDVYVQLISDDESECERFLDVMQQYTN